MAELSSKTINTLIQKEDVLLAIKTCGIRAASNIEIPDDTGTLKSLLLKILNYPNLTEWLTAMVYNVVINNPDIDWTILSENDTIVIEEEITTACTTAIYKISGTVEP